MLIVVQDEEQSLSSQVTEQLVPGSACGRKGHAEGLADRQVDGIGRGEVRHGHKVDAVREANALRVGLCLVRRQVGGLLVVERFPNRGQVFPYLASVRPNCWRNALRDQKCAIAST